ncbi:TBC1 domain family member 23-like [Anarrhichthys ocellatus]|uniref:TBC1 domain family member 23-like n=1 Tax=Anarrhichthys ocellatus TaxID=433405 RepID=UPI0012ED773C|nr:TBC1 domain family member 23-like [Anarrhichthys ocellatus]
MADAAEEALHGSWDQDLAEALDSGSDMEMERGIIQVQEHSAQHRAKMWKVSRSLTHCTLQRIRLFSSKHSSVIRVRML